MKIYGHRGAKGYAPENTMSSFLKAQELGADGVELDVQLTQDRQVVICHDWKIDRTSNGTGKISALTLSALKKLDFGSWYGPQFSGEKIPTLAEFLDWFRTTDLEANIEIKNGLIIYPGIEKEVLKLIEKFQVGERVFISSFYHPSLKLIKEMNPYMRTGALFACRPVNPLIFCRETGADFLHPHWESVDAPWVRQARIRGIQVNCYTINVYEQYLWVAKAGVDGIFSDFPDRKTCCSECQT
ncbi:hypothetical protein DCMF_19320 [Candidatus Formimonas warabiya]|uniref:GP-PDE domain-containing protein n=2 Tax=Formimonas warabiya TaxID=1761012 RepID=A0A3G1L270_FORW1|nr:hypothetical protein DCMF_19320 [Candidatus Formimonas warabiya]